jgi:lia operon protein LiaG
MSGETRFKDIRYDSMKAVSASGNVTVEGASGALEVNESSGNVGIRDFAGSLDIGSTSGNVDIDTQKELTGVTINASSGNATLRLSKDAAFSVDAKTSSGEINTDFDILVSGSTKRGSLSGTCNGGGAPFKISVLSGNIGIYKK